ncbi:LGFP repeat-containing protein [Streptomyces coffeae]|uniref:LGFP repeat-containing protein n=1 Tax=Streptomyces coffeae TaxID=621382 RepID=A0ABS1NJC9_9ACTN|nr:hypothetical protein [Streptomyces coffeae]MBL1099881.1 hypothetical protein [Streptomyces coffeae]
MRAQVIVKFWGDGGEELGGNTIQGPVADASFDWTSLLGVLFSAAKDFLSGGWPAVESDLKKLYDQVTGDVGDSKTLPLHVRQGGNIDGITVPVSRALIYFHAWTGDDIKPSFGRVLPRESTILDLGESRFTRGDFNYEYRFEIPFATIDADKYLVSFGTGDSGTFQDAAIGYTVETVVDPPSTPVMSINDKWTQLGGAAGLLGNASGPEQQTPAPYNFGRWRPFEHALVYWTQGRGAHEVHGAIRDKYAQVRWEQGVLGFPITDELTTPDNTGRFNHFERGSIYWTPALGAHEVHGMNRSVWASLAWERGWLGYPTTDEIQLPDGSRANNFEHGSIRWTPQTGSIPSRLRLPLPTWAVI